MIPNWSEAPIWANYLAMDLDGSWYWFEEMPIWDDVCEWDNVEYTKAALANDTYSFEQAVESLNKRPDKWTA